MFPCLVHFPDRDPRVVMKVDDDGPRAGEELIRGWIVDRLAPASPTSTADIAYEVWVRPAPYGLAA